MNEKDGGITQSGVNFGTATSDVVSVVGEVPDSWNLQTEHVSRVGLSVWTWKDDTSSAERKSAIALNAASAPVLVFCFACSISYIVVFLNLFVNPIVRLRPVTDILFAQLCRLRWAYLRRELSLRGAAILLGHSLKRQEVDGGTEGTSQQVKRKK